MPTPTQMPESLKVSDDGEPIAWESTTICFTKYVSDRRYQKFSPKVRLWYKPYSCSNCDSATAALQSALKDRDAEIERLKKDAERTARNRDMWKGQCERQAAQLGELRAKGGPYADQA